MARPNKTGLDYFPFDVDFFEDEKIIAISGEFGIKGEITTIKLLCAIYRNGYFILWNDLLKYKLLRNLPGISPELIESIVNRLVLWEFFDKALFDSVKVLTSRGIQKRYFEASKRRKIAGNLPYLLIEEVCGCVGTESHSSADRIKDARSNASGCGVNVNNNSSSGDEETSSTDGENSANSINVCNKVVNVCNNPVADDINANKNPLKESKGKEIKKDINFSSFGKEECDSQTESPLPPPPEPPCEKIPIQEIADMWNSTCTNLRKVKEITEKRKRKVPLRIKEMGGWEKARPILETIFGKVQQSNFLNGDNNRAWICTFDWIFDNGSNWVKVYEGNYDNVKPRTIEQRSSIDVGSLSQRQLNFYNYLSKCGAFLLNMPIFPTDEEVGNLNSIPRPELNEIVKEINNKTYLINGRTSIYETIMEVRNKRYGTT